MEQEIEWDTVIDYLNHFHYVWGMECNLCDHFDLEIDVCNKGHRVKKKKLEYGPNAECRVRKMGGCEDFKKFKESKEDREERIKHAVTVQLDCGAQQYG